MQYSQAVVHCQQCVCCGSLMSSQLFPGCLKKVYFGLFLWEDPVGVSLSGPSQGRVTISMRWREEGLEFEVLFCAPLGCTHFETVHPGHLLCTPLVHSNDNGVKNCANMRDRCPKNVRTAAEMYAPGTKCTVYFKHSILYYYISFINCCIL